MRILSFKFEDKKSGWKLDETRFDMFNLLVGASGVGRTKILKALEEVSKIATQGDYRFGEISWGIVFEHEAQEYHWHGETSRGVDTALQIGGDSNQAVEIVRERLESGVIIFDRTPEQFSFGKNNSLPKLKRTDSAIVLLSEEESIAPVADGFRRILFSGASTVDRSLVDADLLNTFVSRVRTVNKVDEGFAEFVEAWAKAGGLRRSAMNVVSMAYVVQEVYSSEFSKIVAQFIGIFPSVVDLSVLVTAESGKACLDVAIKEEGGVEWIKQSEMSSGMLRTFAHLIELHAAPRGAVIVIDEFENSLGINCMSDVVDLVSKRADEIQYILTSHHPYIINNIPVKDWKLVKRHHNQVRVISAREIPALNGASHHDAFTKLINLPEYEEGIS